MPSCNLSPAKLSSTRAKPHLCPAYRRQDYHPYKLIAFSNVQFLDAEFTESALLIPGTDKTIVGNTPAFAPDFLMKGGISFQKEHCFNIVLRLFTYHSNSGRTRILATPQIPKAQIPAYKVFNLSGDLYLTKNLRLIAGISNLTDAKYYDRVFANGIEPAPRLSGYAGLSLEFLTSAGTGVK